MFAFLGRMAYRWRWAILIVWGAALLLSLPVLPRVAGALKVGGFSSPNTEAARAREVLQRELGFAPSTLLVVYQSDNAASRRPGVPSGDRPVAGQGAGATERHRDHSALCRPKSDLGRRRYRVRYRRALCGAGGSATPGPGVRGRARAPGRGADIRHRRRGLLPRHRDGDPARSAPGGSDRLSHRAGRAAAGLRLRRRRADATGDRGGRSRAGARLDSCRDAGDRPLDFRAQPGDHARSRSIGRLLAVRHLALPRGAGQKWRQRAAGGGADGRHGGQSGLLFRRHGLDRVDGSGAVRIHVPALGGDRRRHRRGLVDHRRADAPAGIALGDWDAGSTGFRSPGDPRDDSAQEWVLGAPLTRV